MYLTVYVLCVFSLASAAPVTDELSADGFQTLTTLLSRLGGDNSNNSGGLVFMPPTFSVDVVSLVKWAVETQTRLQQTSRETKTEQVASKHHYPRKFMNMVELGGKMYFFSKNQRLSWAECLAFCRAYDMDLVSIETREEDDLIMNHLQNIGITASYVFTSANKIGRSSFVWMNGEPLIYENWSSGEPNNHGADNCLILWNRKWYDLQCNQNAAHNYDAYFICEDP